MKHPYEHPYFASYVYVRSYWTLRWAQYKIAATTDKILIDDNPLALFPTRKSKTKPRTQEYRLRAPQQRDNQTLSFIFSKHSYKLPNMRKATEAHIAYRQHNVS